MKKISKILVLVISIFLLTACGKTETKTLTLNQLSFELSTEFSDCENDDTKLYCKYKKQNDSCIVDVYSAVPMTETNLYKTVDFLLFVDSDVEIIHGEKEINGYTWTTGYVKNDGRDNQKKLFLINDYKGDRYVITYYCSLDTDMSNQSLNAFENSLKFN